MNEVAASDPAVIAATSTSLAQQTQQQQQHPESHLVQTVSYKSNSSNNLLSNDQGLASAPSHASSHSSSHASHASHTTTQSGSLPPTDSIGGAADHSGAAAVSGGLVSQQQPLDTYGSSSQDYYMPSQQQQQPQQSLSFMSDQMGGLDQGLGAASEVPPAIPMPNQSGLNLGGEAAQEQMSEVSISLVLLNSIMSRFRLLGMH